MNKNPLRFAALAGLWILPSCAVSDNPREGGLFGYLQHGDAGYQRRIDDRRYRLGSLEEENASEQSRTASLKARQASASQTISRLSDLKAQARSLGSISLAAKIQRLESQGDATDAEVRRLEAEVEALRRRSDGL